MTVNLERLNWNHLDLAITASSHIYTLEMYRDELVLPSLRTLNEKTEVLSESNDPADTFAHEDLADLHHSTVEGFLLTTQSMWERSLRGMMIGAAKRQNALPQEIEAIKNARWTPGGPKGIQAHFQNFFGAPLEWFGCPSDLQILQEMGNALRHGDGKSAERLHELSPSLWVNWLPPGKTINIGNQTIQVPANAPRHPSFDGITLPESLLEQMILSVLWFWQDIEFVRCNSFTNKANSVVRKLAEMRTDRPKREHQRVWTPH